MQQWQIQSDKTLKLVQAPLPEIGPEDVLVEVKALGVNRADLLQVKGLYPAPAGFDLAVPGLEYAGVISQVGARVQQRKVGERVMGLIPSAAYSEFVAVHEGETLPMADSLSFAEAATIPEAFFTSYRALFLEGNLQPGQWCLIRPATAGVGLAAVQLANTLGARPIGSSRDLNKLDIAQSFGLHAQVQEDTRLAKQVKELTNGAGVAVIMDMLGPDWNALLQALRVEGTLVLVGVMAGVQTQLNLFSLLTARQKIHPMTMRSQPLENRIRMAKLFSDRLAPLFAQSKLKPLPFKEFSFNDVTAAHTDMAHGHWSGKRVLVL